MSLRDIIRAYQKYYYYNGQKVPSGTDILYKWKDIVFNSREYVSGGPSREDLFQNYTPSEVTSSSRTPRFKDSRPLGA